MNSVTTERFVSLVDSFQKRVSVNALEKKCKGNQCCYVQILPSAYSLRTCYDVFHKSAQTKITTYNLYCVAFCLHFHSGSQGSHVSMVINSNLTQCYYSCCFLCLHSYSRLSSFSSENQNTMVYRTFLTFLMLKFLGEKIT